MNVICWDFDGTLAHSDLLWRTSLLAALDETGTAHGVPLDALGRHITTGLTWHTPEEDYRAITGEKWWAYMNAQFYCTYLLLGVSPDTARSACGKIREIIKRKENYTLYPDAVEALELVRKQGGKNILLSNNYPDLIEVTDQLGISRLLDGFVVSAAVGYDKPRIEIFEIAKSLFPACEAFFMVGDSVAADIIGGKNAGMKTILVHRGYDSEADFCFDHLLPVCKILGKR